MPGLAGSRSKTCAARWRRQLVARARRGAAGFDDGRPGWETSMAKIETLTLRCVDPEAQRAFYGSVLRMRDLGGGRVGYSEREMAIRFMPAEERYNPQPTDLYWKIALSVPCIELACSQLRAAGVECSAPRQFRDVGYLAKAIDPEGFTIELIDHWFEGDRPDIAVDETRLGGGAHLSLLTLRTADIIAVEPEILGWGMSPLSIQPVGPFGFTLYFYAFTKERPHNEDLTAVENRPWLYQRPYTVLEIQHVHASNQETRPRPRQAGYAGFSIATDPPIIPSDRLMASGGD